MRRLIFPAILGLALYFTLFGGRYSIFDLARARSDLERESVELAEAEVELARLEARADSLENDPYTIERIAREEHRMIRDGETLYLFPERETPEPTEPGGES